MKAMLDNPIFLSKFLIRKGYKINKPASVTPFIIERTLFRYIKQELKSENLFPEDIEQFDIGLRDFTEEKLLKAFSHCEEHGVLSTLKTFFIEEKYKKIYKKYKIF